MSFPGSDTVHLLVLSHGMWGNPNHLAEAARIIRETRCQSSSETGPAGERLEVLVAQTNSDEHTYDGIDWGAERIANEVSEAVDRLKNDGKTVTRFSITGYSFGGLVARYAISILAQRGFFETVSPVNFNTIATPHIGIPKYPTFRSSMFAFIGPRLLSRTGEQFFNQDKWDTKGRPLLEVMADPDLLFFQTFRTFQHIRIYANAVNDTTVPYVTGAIEPEDAFYEHETNGLEVKLDEHYSPLIKTYYRPDSPPPHSGPRMFTGPWFKKKFTIPLPPALTLRFPYNVLLFIATPVLLPFFMIFVLVRLSTSSRASRARIRLLEKDTDSNIQRLAHVFVRLERGVEDTVADIMDAPGNLDAASSATLIHDANASGQSADLDPKQQSSSATSKHVPRVLLSDSQRRMVAWLNKLPGLKKELAFIHPVVNSHAVIVSRDVRLFESHKLGEGVLRHWADHFIM